MPGSTSMVYGAGPTWDKCFSGRRTSSIPRLHRESFPLHPFPKGAEVLDYMSVTANIDISDYGSEEGTIGVSWNVLHSAAWHRLQHFNCELCRIFGKRKEPRRVGISRVPSMSRLSRDVGSLE